MANKHGSPAFEQKYVISAGTPSGDDAKLGVIWVDSDDNKLYICTSESPVTFTQLFATPTLSKSVTVEDPTSSEDISIFFTPVAITITEMRAVVRGTTPSVTWTIRHGTDRSATGAEVVTGGTTTTSVSTGDDVTSFNDATIVADSFVWLETTAESGTTDEFHVTLIYSED